jgi:hypothetical protein
LGRILSDGLFLMDFKKAFSWGERFCPMAFTKILRNSFEKLIWTESTRLKRLCKKT